MKQQSLFQSWGRKAKYPFEIAQLIHSFLPNAEELFLEQRIRFLLESTELDTENWHENCDTITSLPGVPPMVDMVISGGVHLKCDLIRTCYFKKRYFSEVNVTRHNRFRIFRKNSEFPAVVYSKPHTFAEFVGYISAAIKLLNTHIQRDMFDSLKEGVQLDISKIPTLRQGKQLFPEVFRFSHLRTTRHDNKHVFHTAPDVQILHLIL